MSRTASVTKPSRYCFPRVSGDEPLSVVLLLFYFKFSPRERG